MNDDVAQTVGCLVYTVMLLLAIAACVVIARFFGFAIGLAVFLVLLAVFLLWLACAYYKANKDAE